MICTVQRSICREVGGFNPSPHWLKMTPHWWLKIFVWGVGIDPPQSQSSKTNITCRWYQSTLLFIPILKTEKPIAFGCKKWSRWMTNKRLELFYSISCCCINRSLLAFQCSSSPSIVKRQWAFAAFASLYDCVLVTTPAAKLMEDQELHDTESHKNFGPDLLLKVLMFNMHEIWSFDSQKKLLKLLPPDVRF